MRAGNDTGLSAASAAPDPGQADSVGGDPSHAIKKLLPKPEISELRRLDLSRVKVKWKCDMPTLAPDKLSYVKVVILKQAFDGEWQRTHVTPFTTTGEFESDAAITTIWRYSAITEYVNASDRGGNNDSASDAALPRELDYGPATYGMIGYRGSLSSTSLGPPGHNLTGSAPRDDWFRIIARSFDDQSPSFLPTNPPVPTGQDAPVLFFMDGYRYFPYQTDAQTELSAEGYVIRGRPFSLQAIARVTPPYTGCRLELLPPGVAADALDSIPELGRDRGQWSEQKGQISSQKYRRRMSGNPLQSPGRKWLRQCHLLCLPALANGGDTAGETGNSWLRRGPHFDENDRLL